MPCNSLAFVWITETEHQVFFRQDTMLSPKTLQRYMCMQI